MGHRSLKIIQTGTIRKLGCCFLFDFYSTMAVSLTVYAIFSGKNSVTLKTGLGVVQDH